MSITIHININSFDLTKLPHIGIDTPIHFCIQGLDELLPYQSIPSQTLHSISDFIKSNHHPSSMVTIFYNFHSTNIAQLVLGFFQAKEINASLVSWDVDSMLGEPQNTPLESNIVSASSTGSTFSLFAHHPTNPPNSTISNPEVDFLDTLDFNVLEYLERDSTPSGDYPESSAINSQSNESERVSKHHSDKDKESSDKHSSSGRDKRSKIANKQNYPLDELKKLFASASESESESALEKLGRLTYPVNLNFLKKNFPEADTPEFSKGRKKERDKGNSQKYRNKATEQRSQNKQIIAGLEQQVMNLQDEIVALNNKKDGLKTTIARLSARNQELGTLLGEPQNTPVRSNNVSGSGTESTFSLFAHRPTNPTSSIIPNHGPLDFLSSNQSSYHPEKSVINHQPKGRERVSKHPFDQDSESSDKHSSSGVERSKKTSTQKELDDLKNQFESISDAEELGRLTASIELDFLKQHFNIASDKNFIKGRRRQKCCQYTKTTRDKCKEDYSQDEEKIVTLEKQAADLKKQIEELTNGIEMLTRNQATLSEENQQLIVLLEKPQNTPVQSNNVSGSGICSTLSLFAHHPTDPSKQHQQDGPNIFNL